jgi:predicted MFS family arabinose efflux permease
MKSGPDPASHPSTPSPDAGPLSRRLRRGYFTLEALNSLGSAYYFNYLFFYLQEHFGFGDRSNLLMAALYGFIYMFAAYSAGPFAEKRGYFFTLAIGFAGISAMMVVGALIPRFYGYSHTAMVSEIITMAIWTALLCCTWPTLQVLLSRGQSAEENSRNAGTYNIIWAGAAALAYLTSGALLDTFGGETLFWLPAGLHLIQLAMLPGLKKLSVKVATLEPAVIVKTETAPSLNPRPISKARTFVFLARTANPFA